METTKHIVVRVPDEVHKRARLLSVQTGEPLQQVLERLLAEWIAEQEAKQAAKDKPKQGK